MAEEPRYHEQNEGWKHEWLADRHCVCFIRPRENGGGFVTVDFERRIFGSGYGKPRRAESTSEYIGKGWKDRIVRDAIDHLERVMSESEASDLTTGLTANEKPDERSLPKFV